MGRNAASDIVTAVMQRNKARAESTTTLTASDLLPCHSLFAIRRSGDQSVNRLAGRTGSIPGAALPFRKRWIPPPETWARI